MKRNLLSSVLFLVYVSITALTYGQNKLPSVDQILERHLQALGGRDKIDTVHSVVKHLLYREGSFVIPDAFIAQMRPYYKTIGDPKDKSTEINEGYDGSAWEYYADPGVVLRTVGPPPRLPGTARRSLIPSWTTSRLGPESKWPGRTHSRAIQSTSFTSPWTMDSKKMYSLTSSRS
jgi:hypothetical protein